MAPAPVALHRVNTARFFFALYHSAFHFLFNDGTTVRFVFFTPAPVLGCIFTTGLLLCVVDFARMGFI
jgi:hypothetical protein